VVERRHALLLDEHVAIDGEHPHLNKQIEQR
jgi:hypothetical protein